MYISYVYSWCLFCQFLHAIMSFNLPTVCCIITLLLLQVYQPVTRFCEISTIIAAYKYQYGFAWHVMPRLVARIIYFSVKQWIAIAVLHCRYNMDSTKQYCMLTSNRSNQNPKPLLPSPGLVLGVPCWTSIVSSWGRWGKPWILWSEKYSDLMWFVYDLSSLRLAQILTAMLYMAISLELLYDLPLWTLGRWILPGQNRVWLGENLGFKKSSWTPDLGQYIFQRRQMSEPKPTQQHRGWGIKPMKRSGRDLLLQPLVEPCGTYPCKAPGLPHVGSQY